MPSVLRINPWASQYEGALQWGQPDDAAGEPSGLRLDVEVEAAGWQPTTPSPVSRPSVVFVDGVRRVELGVVQEDDGRIGYGLFGSYAAGAVVCGANAAVDRREVQRRLVLGGGSRHPTLEVMAGSPPSPAGSPPQPWSSKGTPPRRTPPRPPWTGFRS